MRVHQMTYGMMMGDAISNHVLEIDARLRAWGFETALYAQHIAPEMRGRVQPDSHFAAYLDAADDLLIYHYSIYSPNLRLCRAARGRRLVIYHNITPPEFFRGWDEDQAQACETGRRALQTLSHCDLALGDSEFNRQKLIAAGFQPDRTDVLPIFWSPRHSEVVSQTDALCATLREAEGVNWLTVGRVVPNKKLEDVIRLFAVYRRAINPQARLYIVGSRYIRTYDAALNELIAERDLFDSVKFVGRVSDTDLEAYYQAADLYVCASQHEGFCVPLVESMQHGVPILARRATAVPETLGTAGVLFSELGYNAVAEMAQLLVTDAALRARVIQHQRERLEELSPQRSELVLKAALGRLGLLQA